MLNFRTIILPFVLVFILILAVQLVAAGTEVVSDLSKDSASALDYQERSVNRNNPYNLRSYRDGLGECFDVSLSEFASCRNTSHASARLYRPPFDECFDVPMSELASCRNTSRATSQLYRSPFDECFDVSLSELASCRNASQAIVP